MVKRLRPNEKTLREAEPKPGVSYQLFDAELIGVAAKTGPAPCWVRVRDGTSARSRAVFGSRFAALP